MSAEPVAPAERVPTPAAVPPVVPRTPARRRPRGRSFLWGSVVVAVLGTALGLWNVHEGIQPHYTTFAPVVVLSDVLLAPVTVRAPLPLPPRGPLDRARPGEPIPVDLTVYCLKGTTRRGRWVRDGIVAADTRIFPLGRYVELFAGTKYLGRFLVDDTGLAVKGQIIDIWKPSCLDAIRFGRQRGTAVLVADPAAPMPAPGTRPAAP